MEFNGYKLREFEKDSQIFISAVEFRHVMVERNLEYKDWLRRVEERLRKGLVWKGWSK